MRSERVYESMVTGEEGVRVFMTNAWVNNTQRSRARMIAMQRLGKRPSCSNALKDNALHPLGRV